MKEIYKNLVDTMPDKIPEPFSGIYRQVGFDFLYDLISNYGGSSLYVPTWKALLRDCVYERLRHEFNGNNYGVLAVRYGLCERTVRRVLNERGCP